MPAFRRSFPLILAALLAASADAVPVRAAPPSAAWHCHPWQTEDGLPNNDVTGVEQAPDGSMIVSTLDGITRLDGLRFRPAPFRQPEKALSGVLGMCLARNGTLWLALRGNVMALREDTRPKILPIPGRLPEARFTSMVETPSGGIWLTFDSGPLYLIAGGEVTAQQPTPGGPSSFSSVTTDARGTVWAAGPGGLVRKRDGVLEKMADLPEQKVCLAAARAGGLWLGIGRELFRYSKGSGLVRSGVLPVNKPGVRIANLLEDSAGRLWVGTYADGLHLWTGSTFEPIELPAHDVWSLSEDSRGGLWVGTGGGGACHIRPRAVRLLDEPGGPLAQTARSMCRDSRGDLWIVLQTDTLYTRQSGQWRALRQGMDWPGRRASCVTADASGRVWIGTDEGRIFLWDGTRFEEARLPAEAAGHPLQALLVTRSGEVWAGGAGVVLHGTASGWRHLPPPSATGRIRTMAEDSAGQVWMGTSVGSLLRVESGKLEDRTPQALRQCGDIRTLLPGADGCLWLGTKAGLARLKGGNCRLLTSADGLKHPVVSQLAFDKVGRLWACGNAGIFVIPPDDLAAVFEGSETPLRSISCGRGDGLTSLQANSGFSPNTLQTDGGQLWFATRSGIAMADPALLSADQPPPPPAGIEALLVSGKPVPLTPGGPAPSPVIGPDVSSVSLELSVRSFLSPENVQLMHRLDPLDSAWITTAKTRTARYPHLPAGTYTFRAKAAAAASDWSPPVSLTFTVRPYWWQSVWFRLILLAALMLMACSLVNRIYTAPLRRRAEVLKRESVLEHERLRIARDLHDQIGANLTQISLLSELVQKDGDPRAHLPALAHSAREAVTALDGIVWAVDPRHDTLASLLDYTGQQAVDMVRAAGLRCRVDFPQAVPERRLHADFRHHLHLMVREAVNNAVKHSGAAEVTLHAELLPESLRLVIRDDGRGFDPGLITPGHGLANLQERARTLGGICEISCKAGSGTTVACDLPWPAPGHLPS